MSIRIERVNYSLRKIIGHAISTDLSDPRISTSISVTKVSVSNDLSKANVYVSLFFDTDDKEQILTALRSSTGRLRKIISNKLRIRKIPKLVFLIDSQIHEAFKIDALIDDINNGKFETYR